MKNDNEEKKDGELQDERTGQSDPPLTSKGSTP